MIQIESEYPADQLSKISCKKLAKNLILLNFVNMPKTFCLRLKAIHAGAFAQVLQFYLFSGNHT